MSNKQKAIMDKFEGLMKKMSDEELEKLLLVGEGMVIMSGIKISIPIPLAGYDQRRSSYGWEKFRSVQGHSNKSRCIQRYL